MIRKMAIIVLFGHVLQAHAAADEVRNGGDHVRIAFKEGLQMAIQKVKSLDVDRLDNATSANAKLWLKSNGLNLAADLESSEIIWVEELPANCSGHSCACTGLKPKSSIYLSSKQCNVRFVDRNYAAKLLIHEGVHHFGVTDEALADEIAITASQPQGYPGRLYASLGNQSQLSVTSTAESDGTSDDQSLLFFTQRSGIREANSGFGIDYNFSINKIWSVSTKYFYSQIEENETLQSIALGTRYLLSSGTIQPFSLVNISYGFTSYEDEDLQSGNSYKYGTKDLGVGLGLQYFVWSNSKLVVETERTMLGLSAYDNALYVPASKWHFRFGVGVTIL